MELTRHFLFRVRTLGRFGVSHLVRAELSATRDRMRRQEALWLIERFDPVILPRVQGADGVRQELERWRILPPRCGADLLHIALAIYWEAEMMFTWDTGDLAQDGTRRAVARFCKRSGRRELLIMTPEEAALWFKIR
jgi:hypothetical protein